MLKIAVCDDNTYELEQIYHYLRQYKVEHTETMLMITKFSDSQELLQYINKNGGFNIYILDIIMPHLNGIDTGKKIRSVDKDCAIIFLTLSPEFAIDAYSVHAFQYLLKPVRKERLFSVLDEVVNKIGHEIQSNIAVKTKDGIVVLAYHCILYVEYRNHVLYYHIYNKPVVMSVTIRITFDQAIAQLLNDRRFIHPHKSYVANMSHVSRLNPREFVMKDNSIVPITQSNYKSVKTQYMDFILSLC